MNTRRLEAFLAIVRCGSFAAASQQLNMTQSAISLRIRELEQELGVRVFDRSRRKAALTAEGRRLIPFATNVTKAVNEMKFALESPAALSGRVRLGVTELVAVTWLPALVDELRLRFPKLELALEVGLANNVVRRTELGEIDVALTPGREFPRDLESIHLGDVEFHWMASPSLLPPDWDWDLSSPASPAVLLLAEDSFVNTIANAWFREREISPHRIDTCTSMNVLAALTASGLGISLLPSLSYTNELKKRIFRLVDPDAAISGSFFALFRRNDLDATARVVSSVCREVSTFPKRSARQQGASAGVRSHKEY